MNANDQKIMELKKQIELKKEKLNKAQKFVPETNCVLPMEGKNYNLHTLQKNDIISLLVKLNMQVLSAKDLNLLEDYQLGGFHINAWMTDLKAKLDFVSIKEEQNKLKAMEEKLHLLLTEETKVGLELEEIESML